MNLQELASKIGKRFSKGEVKTEICFEMDINYEDLPSSNRKGKIIELVLFCERHDRLDELITVCKKQRPTESWIIDKSSSSPLIEKKTEVQTQEKEQEKLPTKGEKEKQSQLSSENIANDIDKFTFNDGSLLKLIQNSSMRPENLIEDELTKIKLLSKSRPLDAPLKINIENLTTLNFVEELRIDPRIIVIGNIPYNKVVSDIRGISNPLLKKIEINYQLKNQFPMLTIHGYSIAGEGKDIEVLFREGWIQTWNPLSDIEFRSKDKVGKIVTRRNEFKIEGGFINLRVPQNSTISLVATSVIEKSGEKNNLLLKVIKIIDSTKHRGERG